VVSDQFIKSISTFNRVMEKMNRLGQHQPRRGGRRIAQDKRSEVLGMRPKMNLAPRRGAVKWSSKELLLKSLF
jgi:hypothetical protein